MVCQCHISKLRPKQNIDVDDIVVKSVKKYVLFKSGLTLFPL